MMLAVYAEDPDRLVGFLGIYVLCGCSVVIFIRWLLDSPRSPDPWNEQVAAEMEKDDSVPLCHHCIAPHHPLAHFCGHCGASVGTYTNYMPFLRQFAVGHTLRIGTREPFKRSPLTIVGFLVVSLAEYKIFAPVYWYLLLRNVFSQTPPAAISAPPENPTNEGQEKDN